MGAGPKSRRAKLSLAPRAKGRKEHMKYNTNIVEITLSTPVNGASTIKVYSAISLLVCIEHAEEIAKKYNTIITSMKVIRSAE